MQRNPGPVFKSKTELTRDELADLFQTFAERMREGRLTLSEGAQGIEIALPTGCRIDVQVKDKPKRDVIERELELEITWNVDGAGQPTGGQEPKGGFSVT